MKFTKNPRQSLNCGNSSLRSSDSPQFLTLFPWFSLREFHKAGFVLGRHSLYILRFGRNWFLHHQIPQGVHPGKKKPPKTCFFKYLLYFCKVFLTDTDRIRITHNLKNKPYPYEKSSQNPFPEFIEFHCAELIRTIGAGEYRHFGQSIRRSFVKIAFEFNSCSGRQCFILSACELGSWLYLNPGRLSMLSIFFRSCRTVQHGHDLGGQYR